MGLVLKWCCSFRMFLIQLFQCKLCVWWRWLSCLGSGYRATSEGNVPDGQKPIWEFFCLFFSVLAFEVSNFFQFYFHFVMHLDSVQYITHIAHGTICYEFPPYGIIQQSSSEHCRSSTELLKYRYCFLFQHHPPNPKIFGVFFCWILQMSYTENVRTAYMWL